MIKQLAKSVREYKRPSLITLFLMIGEAVIECAIPYITATFLINYLSGHLLDHVDAAQTVFCGFVGKEAGYFMIFCYCSVAYLAGWTVMKVLVPRYMPVRE